MNVIKTIGTLSMTERLIATRPNYEDARGTRACNKQDIFFILFYLLNKMVAFIQNM
jgi:hypothetical protein